MAPVCAHVIERLDLAGVQFKMEVAVDHEKSRLGSVVISFDRLVSGGQEEILHLCLEEPGKIFKIFGSVPRISFETSVGSTPFLFPLRGERETHLEKICPQIPRINRVADKILASCFNKWNIK